MLGPTGGDKVTTDAGWAQFATILNYYNATLLTG
jgi:hypothetical protein